MKLIIFFLSGLLNGLPGQQGDDSVYYAKVTNVRNYMDQDRVTVTEIWKAGDKSCTMINQRKTIVRGDLGVMYSINLQAETYRVDSLNAGTEQAYGGNALDFRYIGLNYYPVYEWREPQLIKQDTVGKYSCDHFICKGDADFDQISLDYFLTKTDDKSLAAMVNSLLMSTGGSANKREPLAGVINKDKNILILRIIERVENAIAPAITTRMTVNTFSRNAPDEGLFEVPANFKKIN